MFEKLKNRIKRLLGIEQKGGFIDSLPSIPKQERSMIRSASIEQVKREIVKQVELERLRKPVIQSLHKQGFKPKNAYQKRIWQQNAELED